MTAVVVTHAVGNIDTSGLKAELIGKSCLQNFVRVIEFSDTLMKRAAFHSFARMWTLLN